MHETSASGFAVVVVRTRPITDEPFSARMLCDRGFQAPPFECDTAAAACSGCTLAQGSEWLNEKARHRIEPAQATDDPNSNWYNILQYGRINLVSIQKHESGRARMLQRKSAAWCLTERVDRHQHRKRDRSQNPSPPARLHPRRAAHSAAGRNIVAIEPVASVCLATLMMSVIRSHPCHDRFHDFP